MPIFLVIVIVIVNYPTLIVLYIFLKSSLWRPLSAERQSAQMSKITNNGLPRSGTGWFIAVPMWQQSASKG